jgi:hypothetical protein
MSEEQTVTVIPDAIVIDALRNEIAVLNNERIDLTIKMNYQAQIIEMMRQKIEEISASIVMVDDDAPDDEADDTQE